MRAYSLDFRQKIIDTYHNTPISQRQLAKKFNVSLSVVTRLLKKWKETGNLEPKPLPGRPRKLNPDNEAILIEILEEHNDWTLEEYQKELKVRTGIEISTTTICRIFKNLGYPLKKKRCTLQRKKVTESKN